jgi:hypothetical protein
MKAAIMIILSLLALGAYADGSSPPSTDSSQSGAGGWQPR